MEENNTLKEDNKPKIVIVKNKPSVQKRRRLKIGDPDFVPPDGGWGWLIVFACGFSNLTIFPMFQQFGLVLGDRFKKIEISTPQTTFILNMNSASNAGIGLLNGPLFKRFTYRQVAMCGSLIVTISLFLCQYCDSFWSYLITYAILYGCGIGITQSSNALALNSYFKDKRRVATGFSWTTTAFGPIVWPHIIVALNYYYGINGTLLLFSGLALHSFVCSLLLQPVEWHTKFKETDLEGNNGLLIRKSLTPDASERAQFNWDKLRKSPSIFSSQYLHNEDDPVHTGYEITDPGVPMMIKYNDGWYSGSHLGSRLSLASNKSKNNSKPGSMQIISSKASSATNLAKVGNIDRSNSQTKRKLSQINAPAIAEAENEHDDEPSSIYAPHEKKILQEAVKKLNEFEHDITEIDQFATNKESLKKLSIWKKISIFFDFELFKDPVYVNLMLGITLANFAELNFSVLTPTVLKEFHFQEFEIATFMSLLAATDILVRFFIPFIADKIGWDNKTFFLIGVLTMALGRVVLVHTQTYIWALIVAVIIGAGKGLRTIFIALVIPSYVPLERLPAASGLQLATSGLLFILLGPVVGWIRDAVDNYVVTLHLLNICTYTTAVAWFIESFVSKKRETFKPSKSFKRT